MPYWNWKLAENVCYIYSETFLLSSKSLASSDIQLIIWLETSFNNYTSSGLCCLWFEKDLLGTTEKGKFISTSYISFLKAFDLFKGIHGLNNHHTLIEISEIWI